MASDHINPTVHTGIEKDDYGPSRLRPILSLSLPLCSNVDAVVAVDEIILAIAHHPNIAVD